MNAAAATVTPTIDRNNKNKNLMYIRYLIVLALLWHVP